MNPEQFHANIRGSVARHFGNDPTLGAYLPLHGRLQDYSRNGNHATLVGSGTFGARQGMAGLTPTTNTGANGASINDSASTSPTGDFTIMAWIFPISMNTIDGEANSQNYIVTKDAGQPNRSFGVGMFSNGELLAFNSSGGDNTTTTGVRRMANPNWRVRVGRWNHVVWVADQSGTGYWLGYVNGRLQAQSDFGLAGSGTFDSTAQTRIAHLQSNPTNTAFNGLVAEVAIFKRKLTAEEINRYYQESASERSPLAGRIQINGKPAEIYTRDAVTSLPTGTADLATAYTAQDYIDVSAYDGTRVNQASNYDALITIHQFKKLHTPTSEAITVTWKGRSNIAPSSKTITLEIYNFATSQWETLDSNSSAGANTDITLTGQKTTNTSNYHDANNYVCVRVYQQQ